MNNLASPAYKNTLSSSLKDRLKKCGRYHSSPSPTLAKTRCTESKQLAVSTPTKPSPSLGKTRCTESEQLAVSTPTKPSPTLTKTRCLPNEQLTITPTRSIKRRFEENDSEMFSTPCTAKKMCMTDSDTRTKNSPLEKADVSELDSNFSSNSGNLLSPLCQTHKNLYSTPVSRKSCLRRSKLNLQKTPVSKTVPIMDSPTKNSVDNLREIKQKLSSSVSAKEEKLRKLKMVKMYRKKNDLSKLEVLIEKWRNVSKKAIQDLQQILPEPKPSLQDLIHYLQIDDKLLKYNTESDNFV